MTDTPQLQNNIYTYLSRPDEPRGFPAALSTPPLAPPCTP